MSVSFGRWGVSVEVKNFQLRVFLGDFYLKVPSVVEVAWNSIGLYCERPVEKVREGELE